MPSERLPAAHSPARATPDAPANRIRVLLATDSKEPSGVGQHMLTLARGLKQAVDPVLLFRDTPAAAPWIAQARDAGLAAEAIHSAFLDERVSDIASTLARWGAQVMHVHAGISWEGHGLAAAGREAGIPAIVRTEHLPYTLRALKNPLLEHSYASAAQAIDRIICVCEAARRTFRMSGLPSSRFAVVHNGIDPRPARRQRDAVREALRVGDAPLVLTVARLTEQKSHVTLIDAMPAVLASHPDTRFLWVGTGPLEGMLRAHAQALGITQHLHFLGRRDDVPDLLGAADVFCLPSYFEGHPLVVLEAMAAGLPVVAARSLGITEAVRNEVTGLLFPFAHSALLAHALGSLLGDRALARQLGEAGRAEVRQRFSAARMARETLEVYREAMTGAAAHSTAPFRVPAGLLQMSSSSSSSSWSSTSGGLG